MLEKKIRLDFKFPFHGHLRLRLGNVNKFSIPLDLHLNSNFSNRLIITQLAQFEPQHTTITGLRLRVHAKGLKKLESFCVYQRFNPSQAQRIIPADLHFPHHRHKAGIANEQQRHCGLSGKRACCPRWTRCRGECTRVIGMLGN